MYNTMNDPWHQTKGLSITIIVLLITNIVSTVWWAATITKDVDVIKQRPALVERVIRLEAHAELHNRILNKLNNTLDRMDATVARIDKEQAKRSYIIEESRQHNKMPHYKKGKLVKG